MDNHFGGLHGSPGTHPLKFCYYQARPKQTLVSLNVWFLGFEMPFTAAVWAALLSSAILGGVFLFVTVFKRKKLHHNYSDREAAEHAMPVRTVVVVPGFELIVHQNGWGALGCGGVLWDSAIVLSRYLCENAHIVKGKTVLELGAGTGVVGITAAKLGGHVVLTDIPDVIPLLEQNISENSRHFSGVGTATALQLEWGNTTDINNCNSHRSGKREGSVTLRQPIASKFSVILAADVSYLPDSMEALLNTLDQTLSRMCGDQLDQETAPVVLLSYRDRCGEWWHPMVEARGFRIKGPWQPHPSIAGAEGVNIVALTRK